MVVTEVPAGAPVRPLAGGFGSLAHRLSQSARRDRLGLATTVVAVLLVIMAVAAPVLPLVSPTDVVAKARLAPSLHHLLGTDGLGRDVLSRTVWGARHTLLTAVLSTALAAVLGVPLGLVAGYWARWPSSLVMRVMDVLLAFPGLLLALLVVTVMGPGVTTVVIAVGVSYIPIFARVVFAPTRSIKTQDFIAAARVVGCKPLRIMRKQVLPVMSSELIVMVSSAIGWTTLLAATLDFLGFGIRPPAPDWGADLSAAVQYLRQAWWISAMPGIAITITIFVSNYMGDFLASVMNPERLSQRHAKLQTPLQAPLQTSESLTMGEI